MWKDAACVDCSDDSAADKVFKTKANDFSRAKSARFNRLIPNSQDIAAEQAD